MYKIRLLGAATLMASVLATAGCERSSAAAAQTASAATPRAGAVCEVVFVPEDLAGRDKWITSRATRDNINGSKDSAWGRFVSMDDEWIVLEATNIKMDTAKSSQTTYGKAGELDSYEFWIPRDRILYMRAWRK